MHILLKGVCAGLLTATATYAVAHEGKQTVIIREVRSDGTYAVANAKCGGSPEVDVTDEQKQNDGKVTRQRIMICADGGQGPDVVEHLQKARERIAAQSELSAETRAKALAALDAAIARHQTASR